MPISQLSIVLVVFSLLFSTLPVSVTANSSCFTMPPKKTIWTGLWSLHTNNPDFKYHDTYECPDGWKDAWKDDAVLS